MATATTTTQPKFNFTYPPASAPYAVSVQNYLAAHPDLTAKYIATGAVVFDKTDPDTPRLLLLQRAAGDSMPNRWETPGGGCDDEDESILYAVARELWEEAGLRATHIDAPVGAPHFFKSRSGNSICRFHFVVQVEKHGDGPVKPFLNPEEHQRFLWVTEAEAESGKSQGVELKFTTNEHRAIILQSFGHIS